jgi:hypothetical protein
MTRPIPSVTLTTADVDAAMALGDDQGATVLLLPTLILRAAPEDGVPVALTSLLWRLALATAEVEGTDTFRRFIDADITAIIDENHRLRQALAEIGAIANPVPANL